MHLEHKAFVLDYGLREVPISGNLLNQTRPHLTEYAATFNLEAMPSDAAKIVFRLRTFYYPDLVWGATASVAYFSTVYKRPEILLALKRAKLDADRMWTRNVLFIPST